MNSHDVEQEQFNNRHEEDLLPITEIKSEPEELKNEEGKCGDVHVKQEMLPSELVTTEYTISKVEETQESSHKLFLNLEKPSRSAQVNGTGFDTCECGAIEKHGVCVSDNTEENSPETTHGSLKCSVCRQCNFCCKTFLYKPHVPRHTPKNPSDNPMTCDVCLVKYSHKSSHSEYLHTDLCIHNNTKLHVCNACNKTFNQKSHLTRHLRIHNNEKTYECDVCNKSFSEKSSLIKHTKHTHNGEKPFNCNFCNKSFTQISNLTAHLRIHNNEKPYQCDACNRSFTQVSHLTRHLRVHNNEKPYKCNVCNKSFTQISHLTAHLRIHNNEKPYECDVCNKSFREKSSLTKHIKRTHNGEKPYKCKIIQ